MSKDSKIEYNVKHVAFVFENDNVQSVLVTEDGNVFKNDFKGKVFCKDHCSRLGIKYQEVSREEFETENKIGSAPVKPLSKMTKPELLQVCADKGIEASDADDKKTLVQLITDAEKEAEEELEEGAEGGAEGATDNGAESGAEGDESQNNTEE